jgi:hypothetical protein
VIDWIHIQTKIDNGPVFEEYKCRVPVLQCDLVVRHLSMGWFWELKCPMGSTLHISNMPGVTESTTARTAAVKQLGEFFLSLPDKMNGGLSEPPKKKFTPEEVDEMMRKDRRSFCRLMESHLVDIRKELDDAEANWSTWNART